MTTRISTACLLGALTLAGGSALADEGKLMAAAIGEHRSEANIARNASRHPVETLSWFGVAPGMTVVEVSPGGGGWYTEILAPYLRDDGMLYAASYDINASRAYARRNGRRYIAKLHEKPEIYDKVDVTVFAPTEQADIAPAGSADMVLTFRNTHGWLGNGIAAEAFAAFYAALKPGGVLGLVQHRGAADQPQDPKAESGYVTEAVVIELAEKAGFRLVGRSEINANPRDTKDHPEGVWTLPPSFRLEDKDREKYAAIGESDRMTLKFAKP